MYVRTYVLQEYGASVMSIVDVSGTRNRWNTGVSLLDYTASRPTRRYK